MGKMKNSGWTPSLPLTPSPPHGVHPRSFTSPLRGACEGVQIDPSIYSLLDPSFVINEPFHAYNLTTTIILHNYSLKSLLPPHNTKTSQRRTISEACAAKTGQEGLKGRA
jgi:hypothetical protein